MRTFVQLAVIAAVCIAAPSAQAQRQSAPSLAQRLSLYSGSDEPEPARQPSQVRLAAAQAPVRGTREQRQNATPRRSTSSNSGGFFSLGKLFGKKPTAASANQNHPMPYDASTAETRTTNSSASRRTPSANGPAAGGAPRSTALNALQTGGAPASPAPRSTVARSTPVKKMLSRPRTSPATGAERGQRELDEALSALSSTESLADNSAAASADATPDYLQELEEGAAPVAPSPKPAPAPRVASRTPRGDSADFGSLLSRHSEALKAAPATSSAEAYRAAVGDIPDPAEGSSPSSLAATSAGTPAAVAPPTAAVPSAAPQAPVASVSIPTGNTVVPRTMTPTAPASKPANFVRKAPRTNPQSILISSRQPVLVSRVEGPQQLVVGQPATYRVTLENIGDVAANEVLAVVTSPESAEIVEASSSAGSVEQGAVAAGARALNWQLHELAPGQTKTLEVRLTPRSGADMNLGVRFSHAPVGSDAVVKVKEPMLAMTLAGPSEVQFGAPQRFKLTLSNPGTGDADNVELELTPPGADAAAKIHHAVGKLAAGETREIELELTARNAGELVVDAAVTAAGGLNAAATKKVRCVKPELQVDWRGPDEKYSGSVATYFLRVRNPGEAPTDAVTVDVALPEGAKFVSASTGYAAGEGERTIAWQGPALQPGEERFMQLQVALVKPGVNQMNVRASTAAGLRDAKAATTTVIAVADLKLDIADPKGPTPVGEPVVYEIRVRNRGTIAARGVNIVGLFSTGVDPTAVEGAKHTVRDGRIAFQPIDSLAAGEEIVLKIQAKATEAGTHVFRAEVVCQDLEVKLSAEEMTRFFQESNPWDSAATAYGAEPATVR